MPRHFSCRGGGAGIDGERSGLWSEMYRIVGHVRPRYVIIENSPNLTIRGFEKVLCDLSKIGYDAQWQCLSNLSFGYPHKRERIYVIAYPNEIRLQGNVFAKGGFRSIFRKWASNPAHGYSCAKRIHEMPASDDIRNGDGFRYWSHRVGSIGNSVNPTLALYLFNCIKIHNNERTAHYLQ